MALRHQHLIEAINEALGVSKKSKPFRILEIGTYDGVRAKQLIDIAVKCGMTNIEYYGFDFFEDSNPDVQAAECLNAHPIRHETDVAKAFAVNLKLKKVQLFKGDSKVTLPAAKPSLPKMNVIFVNGGHALNTIQSDLENSLLLSDDKTEIVVDNYYAGDNSKGCAFIVDNDVSKRHGLNVKICETVDHLDNTNINIKLVRVKLEAVKSASLEEVIPELVVEPIATPATETPANAETATSSVCHTDLQSPGLRTDICENSTCPHAQQCCDGSRRCEPRLESRHLELPTAGPSCCTPISEERQESDQKLELGVIESQGTENTDNSSDEQRRDIPEELVSGDGEGSSRKSRRSRRSRNKRPGAQTESTDSEPSD